jgi:hypothetical protein
MAKALITLGYKEYVVDVDTAIKLAEILCGGEVHETKWRRDEDGGSTTHVYRSPKQDKINVIIVSDDYINLARLAGEPTK